MRIGVLSDTHDRLPAIDKILDEFRQQQVEAVIHAGDLVAPFAAKRLQQWGDPLYVIYGNNDGERKGLKATLPQIQDGPLLLDLDNRRILVHHFIDWCVQADIDKADIVITGHVHEQVNEKRDGKLFLNPGEACGWITGRCSAAVLDTGGPDAEIFEVQL